MADNAVNVIMNKQMILDQVMMIRSKLDLETSEGRDAMQLVDGLIGMIHASQTDETKRNYPRMGFRRL